MKKTLLVVLCMLLCIVAFASCKDEDVHKHAWSADWSTNATEHWHSCTVNGCTEADSKGPHTGGAATCTEKAKCATCGAYYGELAAHVYDKEVVDEKYLASSATCLAKAKYYKSCACGAKGTETFESGEIGTHAYVNSVVDEKYLKSAANCISPAVYYKSCVCGDFLTTGETFEDGESGTHAYVWDKSADDKDVATCVCGDTKEFNKALDILNVPAGYFEDGAAHSGADSYLRLDKSEALSQLPYFADIESHLYDFYVGEYKILGVNKENWAFDLREQLELAADLKLHGYQNLIIRVTDETGETHDIKYPVLLITKLLNGQDAAQNAQLLYNYTYPATEDKYGCYDIAAAIDFYQKNISETLPADVPEFAFKGVVIRRSGGYRIRTDDIRIGGIFGRLDGAVIEGLDIQCTQSLKSLEEHNSILASVVVNSKIQNVTFTLSRWDGPEANAPITPAANIGYIVSDEFVGNIVVNLKFAASVSFANNELPVLFGGFDNTNIMRMLSAEGVNINLIGYNTVDGEYTMCEFAGTHKFGDSYMSDDNNHWSACAICGEVEEGSTAKHEWNAGTVKVPATCEQGGIRIRTCNICGSEKTVNIGKLGHSYGSLIPLAPATCMATGLEAHYHCKACGKYFDAGKEEIALEAITIEIDKNNHELKIYDAKAPTCIEIGWDAYEACTREGCGYTTRGNDIEKLPHSANVDSEWLHDESGHWKLCATEGCNEIVDKATHDWGTGVVVEDATEETEGLRRYTCLCGKTKDEVIPKKNHVHEYTFVPAVAPDCVTPGSFEHYTCDCGLLFSKSGEEYTQLTSVAVLATGHKFGTTYDSDGTNHWRVCENNNCHEKEMTGSSVALTPCSGGAATCAAKAICDVCGNEYGSFGQHTYTWDKNAADKDIGTCTCGHQEIFDKYLDGITRTFDMEADGYFGVNVLINTSSVAGTYSYKLVDTTKAIAYSINGVEFYNGTGSTNVRTNEILKAHRELHGKQTILAVVTDIYGETHELLIPVVITTATIDSYQDWFDYIYPHDGDKYGYFKYSFDGFNITNNNADHLAVLINGVELGKSIPDAKGAFKGTLIGSGQRLTAGAQYSRILFGNLDGAHIENIVIIEQNYIGSSTSEKKALLANDIKNTTFKDVTVTLWSGNYSAAVVSEHGWLAYGEVSGNTFDNLTVHIQKTCNAIPTLFGNNFTGNAFTSFTLKVDEGVTLPNAVIIGINNGREVSICDANGVSHTPSADILSDDAAHWNVCTACGAKANYELHTGQLSNNGDGTHKVSCACGFASSAVSHIYTWMYAGEVDMGSCECGDSVTFDKHLENVLRTFDLTKDQYFGVNLLKDTAAITGVYSYDLVDFTKTIKYSINGIVFAEHSGSFVLNTCEALTSNRELHGKQNVVALVTDKYGATHEVIIPVIITTATITDYAGWVANIYPANGDTYGYFQLGAQINFASNAELSAPQGAFKGTLIGNNCELIGSQGYGRHIFGNLDGATIENVRIRENGYRGSYTRNGLPIGLLGCEMKNCTLNNVTFTLQDSAWPTAIDISAGTGWLVSGEVSGNTMTAVSIVIGKTVNALAPLFGSNFSNNTFEGFTWTVNEGQTVPAGVIVVGKKPDGTIVNICDLTSSGAHSLDSGYSHDASGHWLVCKACGTQMNFEAHSGAANLGDGTHNINCSCGYKSTAEAHAYTWQKTLVEKDIGECSCGATVEFDKELEGVVRQFSVSTDGYFGENVLKDTASVTATYSADLVDFDKPIKYSINGQEFENSNSSFVLQTNEIFMANVEAGNDYDIAVVVTDIYGETHELTITVRMTE